MSISRSIVNHVIGQKKAVLSPGRRRRPEPAHQRLDRRPQDPLGHVRPAPDARRRGPGDHPARHERPPPVLAGRPRHPRPPSPARRPWRSRTRRCTRSCSRTSALERDLSIAETVQKRFLPQSVPKVPGYEFFAFYQPTYRGRRRLLRLHPAPVRQAGDRPGRRRGQGGGRRPDDGQVLRRDPVLRLDRALAPGRHPEAEQPPSAPPGSTRSS